MKNNILLISREYEKGATFGKLTMPSGKVFDTLELKWQNNEKRVSCIPEGVYELKKRYSPIIQRTTRQRYQQGWEVTNVDNRTYIMIHIGNFTRNFLGCIGVGLGVGVINGEKAILNSAKAFDQFMDEMKEHDIWQLVISEKPQ